MVGNFLSMLANILFALAYFIIAVYSFYSNLIYVSKEIKRKSPPLLYSAKYIIACFLSISIVFFILCAYFAINGYNCFNTFYGRQIDKDLFNFYLFDYTKYLLGFSNIIVWSTVAYYYRQITKNKFKKIKNIYCLFEALTSLALIVCCTTLITSTSQIKFSLNEVICGHILDGLSSLLLIGVLCSHKIESRSMRSLASSKEEILRVLECPSKTSKTVLFTMRSISRNVLSISIVNDLCTFVLIICFTQRYLPQTKIFFAMNLIILIMFIRDISKLQKVVAKSMVQTKMEE